VAPTPVLLRAMTVPSKACRRSFVAFFDLYVNANGITWAEFRHLAELFSGDLGQ